MVTTTIDTTTDYLYVDETETVTLADENNSVTVEYAKRSRVTADNQISGMQVGDILWDLAKAEVSGDITEPLPEMTITDADGAVFVIIAVPDLVISAIWQCHCRKGA